MHQHYSALTGIYVTIQTLIGHSVVKLNLLLLDFLSMGNIPCTRKQPYPQSVINPSRVSVVSRSLGTPLHIISITGGTPRVTAALSISELIIQNTEHY